MTDNSHQKQQDIQEKNEEELKGEERGGETPARGGEKMVTVGSLH